MGAKLPFNPLHNLTLGARDWTRTSTILRTLAPEASASTNSATRALQEAAFIDCVLPSVNKALLGVLYIGKYTLTPFLMLPCSV